ncbi:GntR domain protein (fragment) [Paraburkholderia ribeironis]|uniref:GntR domain protein n=1 Tax=Paraburkholderia ribeironis TaxID=1247936 RepID=A0A1N7SQC8_9BURK
MRQRREDVNFHDIVAAANPKPFLRFGCELIDEMIRQLIESHNDTSQAEHERFSQADVKIQLAMTKTARDLTWRRCGR